MSKSNFNEKFKRGAVCRMTERGYPISEVSQQLGASQHSGYEWKKRFSSTSGWIRRTNRGISARQSWTENGKVDGRGCIYQIDRLLPTLRHLVIGVLRPPLHFTGNGAASVPTAYTSGAFETRAWSRVGLSRRSPHYQSMESLEAPCAF
ncbi:transposase [Rhizobium sp. 2YAF20]|uniref:transposase n=1 Tax=Rhizobium sp. 2YAF20 TaxID=3233027 RepID=UPI003F9B1C89